jgi:hypothetical protein
MAKGRLPEGYRGVEELIKEFRIKNPKGKIETSAQDLGDGFVLITAKITTEDGAVGSGMSEADVQSEKAVAKAESGAIRRALLTLGYESVEGEEEEEVPAKEERKSFKRDEEPKKEARKDDSDDDQEDAEDEVEEEKPRSRFGSKAASKDDSDEEQEEGEPKFKRGSRFQRG